MSDPVRITFLGGLGEIGRNMATIEVDGSLAVIDVGVLFPNPEHYGVDLILPDWSWMRDRADDVQAVFLTHGHLDHIGAMPYFLRDFPDVTVYGTRLTLAFVEAQLEEWDDIELPPMAEVAPGDIIDAEPFDVEVIQVNHSIPDGCAFAFRTPEGMVVHSGDFKLDQTPVDDKPTDLAHLARLGDEGVDLLLADSTNADVPGHVQSERVIGATLRDEFLHAEGMVVVTSFASHVHRIQQVLDAAAEVGRRPVLVGRSMIRNMPIAAELGYLDLDPDSLVDITDVGRHDPSELVIICTGSQGEPYSALSLMAAGEHKHVEVGEGDLVVLASSLIPGNEKAIYRSINGLARRGCKIVHRGNADVHVSGHANRDDLVLFHNMLEPEWFIPVHGEFRHLAAHRDIAIATGCPPEHVLLCEDGAVVELRDGVATMAEEGVPAGQVYVDGLLSDVGTALLRDRGRLADDGVCVAVVTIDPHKGEVVETPLLTQRGVIFSGEDDELIEAATKALDTELAGMKKSRFADQEAVQRHVVQTLARFWKAETGRRPVILPVVLEA